MTPAESWCLGSYVNFCFGFVKMERERSGRNGENLYIVTIYNYSLYTIFNTEEHAFDSSKEMNIAFLELCLNMVLPSLPLSFFCLTAFATMTNQALHSFSKMTDLSFHIFEGWIRGTFPVVPKGLGRPLCTVIRFTSEKLMEV